MCRCANNVCQYAVGAKTKKPARIAQALIIFLKLTYLQLFISIRIKQLRFVNFLYFHLIR
jgi:hypothetical protein